MVIVIDLESGEISKSSPTKKGRSTPKREHVPPTIGEPELQPVNPEPIRPQTPPPILPADMETWLDR